MTDLATTAAAQPPDSTPMDLTQQGLLDGGLSWVTLYVPSWGPSMVLHVAVFVLLAFMAWQPIQAETPYTYVSEVFAPRQPKLQKQQKPQTKPQTGRGKAMPVPSAPSILHEFTLNPPDVADNLKDQLEILGIGGGGHLRGGMEGLGDGRPEFYGLGIIETGGPSKIVYIVDRSGSMTDSIPDVKLELKRSINELPDDKEFHVIFYSTGPCLENAPRRLVKATERNKQQAFGFIDSVIAQGETDPSDAIRRAFACQPEVIYLLTDGEFDRSIIPLCKGLNGGGKVTIHTIGFLYTSGAAVLKQIADENNGDYKFVDDKYLQQTRP